MIAGIVEIGAEALGSAAGKAARSVESFGTIKPVNRKRGQHILPDLTETSNQHVSYLTDLTNSVEDVGQWGVDTASRSIQGISNSVGKTGSKAVAKLGGSMRKVLGSKSAVPILGAIQMSTQIMQNQQLNELQESVDMVSLQLSLSGSSNSSRR